MRFRHLFTALTVAAASVPLAGVMSPSPAAADEPPYHRIVFPVQEKVSYSDDFGAARAGGRSHQGNDLMGAKLDHELAAADGTISWVKVDTGTGPPGDNAPPEAGDGGGSW